jgi:hypothetical protein
VVRDDVEEQDGDDRRGDEHEGVDVVVVAHWSHVT